MQINWSISIWYDFLLKVVSKQTLITATVINYKIIIVLFDYLIILTKGANEGFDIMEYKNFSWKFTLQAQAKYKNAKIQGCLQELLPWDMSFQSPVKKHTPPKFLTAKIQTLEKQVLP